jgi:hypothetical protein
MMVESYKIKSKLATAIGAVATIISILGVNQLKELFPQFGTYIPIIVAIAAWYLSQSTENKRVEVAEQLVEEKYVVTDPNSNECLNDEYEVGDESDGC